MSLSKPAVFLDRDGTLIEEVGYLTDPGDVALLPGSAEGLQSLRRAGYLCILVTNQSAIGRGLLDEPGLARIHSALSARLAEAGTGLDAIYHCPEAPDADGEPISNDRKPAPGMLIRGAREHGVALECSWMVGDRLRDLEAGRRAGCRGNVLVRTGYGAREEAGLEPGDFVCRDLRQAARLVLERDSATAAGERLPRPQPPTESNGKR